MGIQTDYAAVDSLLIAYPDGFKNEFEELVPFYDKLITKIPPEISTNIIVNNRSALEKLKLKFKSRKLNIICEEEWDDIWVRDSLGVALGEKVVKAIYDATYCNLLKERRNFSRLNKLAENIISNHLNRIAVKLPIKLDGGNIVLNKHYAFITQKVFSDNPELSKEEIEKQITEKLGVVPIIVPINNQDFIGHTDGYMAFLNENTLAVVEYPSMDIFKADIEYSQKLAKYCADLNLRVVAIKERPLSHAIQCECSLKCQRKICSYPANGVYINFLRLNNTIILPEYTLPTLKETIYYNNVNEETLSNMGFQVIKINCDLLGQHGGSLRCLSFAWNSKN